MKIIPAIDVIGGKCVRLSQGDYDRVKTYGIPRDMALEYANVGFTRLHVVDLDIHIVVINFRLYSVIFKLFFQRLQRFYFFIVRRNANDCNFLQVRLR